MRKVVNKHQKENSHAEASLTLLRHPPSTHPSAPNHLVVCRRRVVCRVVVMSRGRLVVITNSSHRRSVVSARRRSVVSTAQVLVVVRAVVSRVRRRNSGACVRSVVGWAHIMRRSSKATSGHRNGADFRVSEAGGALLALPELGLGAGALGVAVGRAGAEALLFLVVAACEQRHGDGEEEEEAGVVVRWCYIAGRCDGLTLR
jgi:hypothetical protein